MKMIAVLTVLFIAFFYDPAQAADAASQQKLQACLKKADDLPDIAAANAEAWFWRGGGEAARLCRDYALFNAGEFVPAGKGFIALAHLHEKNNPKQAATLYAQAGLAFLRGDDRKNSDIAYNKAVALTPNDPEILTDRATARIGDQRYWDAITDLNQALKIRPKQCECVASTWAGLDTELGNEKKAARRFPAGSRYCLAKIHRQLPGAACDQNQEH